MTIDRIPKRVDASEQRDTRTWFYNRGGVRIGDVNGDKLLDVAVSFGTPDNSYNVFVFLCTGTSYQLVNALLDLDPLSNKTGLVHGLARPPKWVFFGDLIGDDRAELVLDIGVSGATTIWMSVKILRWDDSFGKFAEIDDATIEYPADSGSYSVTEPMTSNSRNLIVRTGYSGSGPASGPQRQHTITYIWNGKQFTELRVVSDPPTDRLHAAYDALYAANHGKLAVALGLYERVFHDQTLTDWSDDTRRIVQAFASYGVLTTTVALYGINDPKTAEAYNDFIRRSASDKDNTSLWFKYGRLFMQVGETSMLTNTCIRVNAVINEDITKGARPNGPKGPQSIDMWPSFSYNINWIPTERGLSFCPF